MADDIVQVRIKGRHIIQEGRVRDGQVIWTTPKRGKQYIDLGIAEAVMASTGPTETKPAGPSETKPAGGAEKKSSGVETATPSTDSAKSSAAPGPAAPSSVLAADRVSPPSSSSTSSARGRRGRGKSAS